MLERNTALPFAYQGQPFIRTAVNSNYTFPGPPPTPPADTVGERSPDLFMGSTQLYHHRCNSEMELDSVQNVLYCFRTGEATSLVQTRPRQILYPLQVSLDIGSPPKNLSKLTKNILLLRFILNVTIKIASTNHAKQVR